MLADETWRKTIDFEKTGVTGLIIALPTPGNYKISSNNDPLCAAQEGQRVFNVGAGDTYKGLVLACSKNEPAHISEKTAIIIGAGAIGGIVVVVAAIIIAVMIHRKSRPPPPMVSSYLESLRKERGGVSYTTHAKGKKG
jgi:hypothetical protein